MESLVIITGAGASRDLGKGPTQMPLMREWSGFLRQALDDLEEGLAEACDLHAEMSGPDFEAQLGKVLKWDEMIDLAYEFIRLGHPSFQASGEGYAGGLGRNRERLGKVRAAVNETLYDLFDQRNIDDQKAASAYGSLLAALGDPKQVVIATTNYDRSAEAALRRLGRTVATGFDLVAEAVPELDPKLLLPMDGSTVPVIHLHGAVGWYRRNGTVYDHRAGQPFNDSLGTPVVLYPDPNKDPTDDPAVSGLWAQFDQAIRQSDGVVVVGHSLHDRTVVDALRRTIDEGKPVAIGYHDKGGEKHVQNLVAGASAVPLTFGPAANFPQALFADFEGGRSPREQRRQEVPGRR